MAPLYIAEPREYSEEKDKRLDSTSPPSIEEVEDFTIESGSVKFMCRDRLASKDVGPQEESAGSLSSSSIMTAESLGPSASVTSSMVAVLPDPSIFATTADVRREAGDFRVVDGGLLRGGGMDMLAFPTDPVGPVKSANRLFLLLRETLEEELLSKE